MGSSWNATSFVTGEAQYSSGSNYQPQSESQPKRPRHASDIPSSNFNGHWGAGAPIYQNHHHHQLGLGMEAAVVGFVLLPTYSCRIINFPGTIVTPREQNFPHPFGNQASLLSMTKDEYKVEINPIKNPKLQTQRFNVDHDHDHDLGTGHAGKKVNEYQLFEKILSPSDVGKSNRLVIPKKSAVKYFPLPLTDELTFYDESMKQWKFRYSFWKSNKIYVFTRGWNTFFKEKGLRAKDKAVFSQCEFCDGGSGTHMSTFFRISVKYINSIVKEAPIESVDEEKKSIRLFGVEIFEDCKQEDRE